MGNLFSTSPRYNDDEDDCELGPDDVMYKADRCEPGVFKSCSPNEYRYQRPCTWSDWGACSADCDGGTQERTCQLDESECDAAEAVQACNEEPCVVAPVDGGWTVWTPCSATCGGGTQTRSCTNPRPSSDGAPCVGSTSQSCNTMACECVPTSTGMRCNNGTVHFIREDGVDYYMNDIGCYSRNGLTDAQIVSRCINTAGCTNATTHPDKFCLKYHSGGTRKTGIAGRITYRKI
jgi:hypothetical protein